MRPRGPLPKEFIYSFCRHFGLRLSISVSTRSRRLDAEPQLLIATPVFFRRPLETFERDPPFSLVQGHHGFELSQDLALEILNGPGEADDAVLRTLRYPESSTAVIVIGIERLLLLVARASSLV